MDPEGRAKRKADDALANGIASTSTPTASSTASSPFPSGHVAPPSRPVSGLGRVASAGSTASRSTSLGVASFVGRESVGGREAPIEIDDEDDDSKDAGDGTVQGRRVRPRR